MKKFFEKVSNIATIASSIAGLLLALGEAFKRFDEVLSNHVNKKEKKQDEGHIESLS